MLSLSALHIFERRWMSFLTMNVHLLALGVTLLAACVWAVPVPSLEVNRRQVINSSRALEPCTAENCKLPNCYCSGVTPPGGLTPPVMPQIVMLTFDDSINSRVYTFQKDILSGKYRNANGCPMTATFFVSHEYTDYYMAQVLHSQGNDIADHSITHRTPTTWWATATEEEWHNEIGGEKTILELFGNIPAADIRGFRAPYLQTGGDREFRVLKDLGFEYESSMPTCKFRDPPMFPYTLDYARTQECMIPPCPEDSYPGVWEVPLVGLTAERTGEICYSMVDSYVPTSTEDAYHYLRSNFDRHYSTNRAPYGIYMHAAWFLQHPNMTFPALERLIGELAEMDDVWLVSVSQMLDWMRTPQTQEQAKSFAPWQCSGTPPHVCSESESNNCHYTGNMTLCNAYQGVRSTEPSLCGADEEHYMRTCSTCPPHYPWYGNPEGK